MGNIHNARLNFLQVVIPAYEEMGRTLLDGVTGDRRDIVALGRAAAACLHLSDYVAREAASHHDIPGAPKSRDYIKDLAHRFHDFAVTRDVANSFKHRELTDQDRTLDGIEALLDRWALIRFKDEKGFYWATRKVVLVRLNDGRELLAEDLIYRCIRLWANELVRLCIIPAQPSTVHVTPKSCPRPPVDARPKISMIGRAGERFECQPIVLYHDSESNSYLVLSKSIGRVEVEVEMLVEPAFFGAGTTYAEEHRFTICVRDSETSVE